MIGLKFMIQEILLIKEEGEKKLQKSEILYFLVLYIIVKYIYNKENTKEVNET